MESSKKNFSSNFPLLLALSLGAFFRFYHLTGRGMCFWDEGLFLMGARFVNWRVSELLANGWQAFSHQLPPNLDLSMFPGFPVFLWKPFHVLLLSTFTAVMGDSYATAQVMSALFGVASIVVAYAIGYELGGRCTGGLSALVLALCPYHILYSRYGLHEIDSGFFILLGFWFYLLSLKHYKDSSWHSYSFLTLAALSQSLGFTASYRWLVFFPLYFLFEVAFVLLYRDLNLKRILLRTVFFLLAIALVILSIEMFQYAMIHPHFSNFEKSSYIESLEYKFQSESTFDLKYPFYYLGVIVDLDGWLLLGFYAAGMGVVLYRRNFAELCLVAMIMWPLVLYSITSQRLYRTISVIFPFLAVIAGLALSSILELAQQRISRAKAVQLLKYVQPVLLVLVTLALFSNCLFSYQQYYDCYSEYSKAVEWIRAQGTPWHVSTMWPVTACLAGKENSLREPETMEELLELRDAGVKYLLVDWQKYVWNRQYIREIEGALLPVKAFRNTYAEFRQVLGENYLPQDLDALPKHDPTLGYIKIYDLSSTMSPSQLR